MKLQTGSNNSLAKDQDLAASDLPILDIVEPLIDALKNHQNTLLIAPPGAGKTTALPLHLLAHKGLIKQRIIMLEPRRLAVKNAAHRLADTLGESVGNTIGYRMRQDSCVSPQTRLEVVTDGVFLKLLQQDPALEDYDLIIFDECHERSLNNDLAFALCRYSQMLFRDDLRLLFMSATADIEAFKTQLNDAPIIISKGRQYPIDISYWPLNKKAQQLQNIADAIRTICNQHFASGPPYQHHSVLIFLPGKYEIDYCAQALESLTQGNETGANTLSIHKLYAKLSLQEQRAAISNPSIGQAKIVLATSIAETSITIEDISLVIDSGLSRSARYEARTGLNKLQTFTGSKASAQQRAGRAGRMRPGQCIRLWPEESHHSRPAHDSPEICHSELSQTLLQVLDFGANIDELDWLQYPPAIPLEQASDLLIALGAVATDSPASSDKAASGLTITPYGHQLAGFSTDVRLASMLIEAETYNLTQMACRIAALLELSPQINPQSQLDFISVYENSFKLGGDLAKQLHQQIKQFESRCQNVKPSSSTAKFANTINALSQADKIALLLAKAFPDRIAKRRPSGQFTSAGGRGLLIKGNHKVAQSIWIVCAELGGFSDNKQDQVYLACALDEKLFESVLKPMLSTVISHDWDLKQLKLRSTQSLRIGAIDYKSGSATRVSVEQYRQALMDVISKHGIDILPFSESVRSLRQRIDLCRKTYPHEDWPDTSDKFLASHAEQWLAPFITEAAINTTNLSHAIEGLLSWDQRQALDQRLPLKFDLGVQHCTIDYQQSPPVISAKLQGFFGQSQTPSIADGKIKLLLHLLSPAGRPLQITQDLEHFWQHSYHEVKKEMKSRYPKHPWPEDPQQAQPSLHTKNRAAVNKP